MGKSFFKIPSIPALFIYFILLFIFYCFSYSVYGLSLNFFIFIFGVSFNLSFLFFKRRKDIFETFYLFNAFYILFYFSALVLYARGFYTNEFISGSSFYSDLNQLYTVTLVLVLFSYFSVFLGYYAFLKPGNLSLKKLDIVEGKAFLVLALFIYFIGFLNFYGNVLAVSSGDIFDYYSKIAVLRDEMEGQSLTSIGYNLIFLASYMIFLRSIQLNYYNKYLVALIVLSVVIYFSKGRITGTIFYGLSFLGLYYYNNGIVKLNNKYVGLISVIAVTSIFLYSLRYMSSVSYNNNLDSAGSFFKDFFQIESLLYFIFDKGNSPNFAILMKVVDSWGRDIGYLFGTTLLAPLYNFVSPNFFGMIDQPAFIAKQQWYLSTQGGNIPLTGVGEMIANFSIYGFIVGMFAFGVLGAIVRNFLLATQSNLYLIFYLKFSLNFFMLYPKGEFNNFDLFWFSIFSILILFLISLMRSFKGHLNV